MSESLSALRKRPMLAPLLLPLFAVIAAGAGVFWIGTWARTTVVILVRHGEAEAVTTGDPNLSLAGERRAAGLGGFLADALPGGAVDHLYAGDTRRAQQTAAALANEFKLPINLLASSDWVGLPARIRREHRGETVVVVGYANTLPGVLNQLGARPIGIDADDYDSVFVVVMPSPGPNRVLRLRHRPGETAPGPSASR